MSKFRTFEKTQELPVWFVFFSFGKHDLRSSPIWRLKEGKNPKIKFVLKKTAFFSTHRIFFKVFWGVGRENLGKLRSAVIEQQMELRKLKAHIKTKSRRRKGTSDASVRSSGSTATARSHRSDRSKSSRSKASSRPGASNSRSTSKGSRAGKSDRSKHMSKTERERRNRRQSKPGGAVE